MIREVENEMNRLASVQRLPPPYIKLLFGLPDKANHRRFNIQACNEDCTVFTLNSDQSFLQNKMIVHQCNKNIVFLKNVDKPFQLFT